MHIHIMMRILGQTWLKNIALMISTVGTMSASGTEKDKRERAFCSKYKDGFCYATSL